MYELWVCVSGIFIRLENCIRSTPIRWPIHIGFPLQFPENQLFSPPLLPNTFVQVDSCFYSAGRFDIWRCLQQQYYTLMWKSSFNIAVRNTDTNKYDYLCSLYDPDVERILSMSAAYLPQYGKSGGDNAKLLNIVTGGRQLVLWRHDRSRWVHLLTLSLRTLQVFSKLWTIWLFLFMVIYVVHYKLSPTSLSSLKTFVEACWHIEIKCDI